jgi:hypothetical protein
MVCQISDVAANVDLDVQYIPLLNGANDLIII